MTAARSATPPPRDRRSRLVRGRLTSARSAAPSQQAGEPHARFSGRAGRRVINRPRARRADPEHESLADVRGRRRPPRSTRRTGLTGGDRRLPSGDAAGRRVDATIVAVADAVEAMTSSRPYRRAMVLPRTAGEVAPGRITRSKQLRSAATRSSSATCALLLRPRGRAADATLAVTREPRLAVSRGWLRGASRSRAPADRSGRALRPTRSRRRSAGARRSPRAEPVSFTSSSSSPLRSVPPPASRMPVARDVPGQLRRRLLERVLDRLHDFAQRQLDRRAHLAAAAAGSRSAGR